MRALSKEGLPEEPAFYEADLFFPATGLFNYSCNTPSSTEDVAKFIRGSEKDVNTFRILNFATDDMAIAAEEVPELRNTQTSIDIVSNHSTLKIFEKIIH